MVTDGKYLISQQKQIIKYLNLLSQERCLISAVFGKDDKDTFLSAILDLDEKKQTLTIDCGPKEYLNKKLLDSSVIKCSSNYKGIAVFFEARKVQKAGEINAPKFILPLPKSLFWVQRREFFRVKSPLSKNSLCKVDFKGLDVESEFKIHDLSANGFSMLSDTPQASPKLRPKAEFNNCKLILKDEEPLTISFEVRNKLPFNLKKPKETERIGCLLTHITPRIESTILRYIQNIERENKLKEK